MSEDILYEIRAEDGRSMGVAHGMQIGRFAVRCLLDRPHDDEPVYVVDHTPTGLRLTPPIYFGDAMMIADDVSRFAESDPDAVNPPFLLAQLGEQVMVWLSYMQDWATEGRPLLDFRKFCVQMYTQCTELQELSEN